MTVTDDPYAWPGLDRTEPIEANRIKTEDEGNTLEFKTSETGNRCFLSSDGKITYFSGDVRFDPGTGRVMPVSEILTTGDAGIFLEAAIDALEPGLYRKCSHCGVFEQVTDIAPACCERCA